MNLGSSKIASTVGEAQAQHEDKSLKNLPPIIIATISGLDAWNGIQFKCEYSKGMYGSLLKSDTGFIEVIVLSESKGWYIIVTVDGIMSVMYISSIYPAAFDGLPVLGEYECKESNGETIIVTLSNVL